MIIKKKKGNRISFGQISSLLDGQHKRCNVLSIKSSICGKQTVKRSPGGAINAPDTFHNSLLENNSMLLRKSIKIIISHKICHLSYSAVQLSISKMKLCNLNMQRLLLEFCKISQMGKNQHFCR